MTDLSVDQIVDTTIGFPQEEWSRVAAQLCGAREDVLAYVEALLETYRRSPETKWPPGPLPCRVGPFHLEQVIGEGAHGVVYLARRPPLDGYVAVKLMRPGPGMTEFIEVVRREANLPRRVHSAHVIPVFDAGRIENGPYYIEMAVCADADRDSPGAIRLGRSLRHLQTGVTPDQAARFVEDLCSALDAAHRAGIVHGDVKPENVLVTPETRRVLLADFGIATSLATHTEANRRVAGTWEYMPPEQIATRSAASVASDVYTLGGTLYFLLTGTPPHPNRTPGHEPPVAPLPDAVPVRLREIVERALDPEPAQRPASAAELGEELRRYRELEPTWHDRQRLARRVQLGAQRRRRELVTAALLIAVAATAGTIGYRRMHAEQRAIEGRVAEQAMLRDRLTAELASLARERDEVNQDLGKTRAELERDREKLAEVPALRKTLLDAQKQLSRAEERQKIIEADVASTRGRVGELEARARADAEARAKLEERVRAETARAGEATAAAERANAARESAALDAARKADALARVEAELSAARGESNNLHQQLGARAAQVSLLQEQLAAANARASAAESRAAARERPASGATTAAPAQRSR